MLLPLLITAALFAPQDPAPVPGPSGFRALSFADALLAAEREKRPLLLAFSEPDSDECRAMEELTWKDPVMLRWLEARVVALRVDLRADAQLAQRFHVERGPVTLLVTSAGEEGERFSGVVQARELMALAQPVLYLLPEFAALRKRLNAEPANPLPRLELAQAYISCRMPERAAEHMLWAWDNGAAVADFQETRCGVLAYQLGRLARSDKRLRKELAARSNAARERLLRFAEGDDSLALVRDVSALNTALEAHERQLELWDALKAKPDLPPALLTAAFNEGLALLLFRSRRFEELLQGRGDVLAYLHERFAALASDALAAERERIPVDPDAPVAPGVDPIELRRNELLASAVMYMEALAAARRSEEARSLAQLVLAFDARPRAYITLAAAAGRGGAREIVRELGDAARKVIRDPADLAWLEKVLALHLPEPKSK